MRRPFREDKNHMNYLLYANSKENRLTCHPVGRPLSAVGFTNTKTQPGANALLRDNDLLSRPRTSNHKKNQKQSPASPVCPASPDLRVGLPGRTCRAIPPCLRLRGRSDSRRACRRAGELPDNPLAPRLTRRRRLVIF